MAELGEVQKVPALGPIETPEAAYLGMRPEEAQIPQGPLTVAALGADPPERSTHFHLSLMGFQDGEVRQSSLLLSSEELRTVLDHVPRLNTKTLTFVEGEDRDHGLVWEGLGDMRTIPPDEADGKPIKTVLPEGDAESILRRYIDDSTNLLGELELNEKRLDEGLPPLNLLWPWGEGVRLHVPNLALRRGEPSLVVSDSMRMQGLVRLAGYRHVDRALFRKGMNFSLSGAAGKAKAETSTIIVLSAPAQLRNDEKMEELEWFARQMTDELLSPLWDLSQKEPLRLLLVAPALGHTGLSLRFESGKSHGNRFPFDERALEEREVDTREAWKQIDETLSS